MLNPIEKSILFVPELLSKSRFSPSTPKPDKLHPKLLKSDRLRPWNHSLCIEKLQRQKSSERDIMACLCPLFQVAPRPIQRLCSCRGVHHFLVRLFWSIHRCNIISYVMRGYYHIPIHSISYTFIANPNGQYMIITLSVKMVDIYLFPLAHKNGQWSANIVLETNSMQVIFWHASFAKKIGDIYWHQILSRQKT